MSHLLAANRSCFLWRELFWVDEKQLVSLSIDSTQRPQNNQFIFSKSSTPAHWGETTHQLWSSINQSTRTPLGGTVCRCVQVVTADQDLLTKSPLRHQGFNRFPVQPVSVSPVLTPHHCSSRHLVPQPSHYGPPVAPEHWLMLIISPSKLYLLIGSLLWTPPRAPIRRTERIHHTQLMETWCSERRDPEVIFIFILYSFFFQSDEWEETRRSRWNVQLRSIRSHLNVWTKSATITRTDWDSLTMILIGSL